MKFTSSIERIRKLGLRNSKNKKYKSLNKFSQSRETAKRSKTGSYALIKLK
jgi:hypothetical protein